METTGGTCLSLPPIPSSTPLGAGWGDLRGDDISTYQPTKTTLSKTDILVVNAATALLRALELEDAEYSEADAMMAVMAVDDWMDDMGCTFVVADRADTDTIVGQVCAAMGIEVES